MNFTVKCFPHFDEGVEEVLIEDQGRVSHYYFPLKNNVGEDFERELLLAYQAGQRDGQADVCERIKSLPILRREH